MLDNFDKIINENKKDFFRYLKRLSKKNRNLFVQGNLLDIFDEFANRNNLKKKEELRNCISMLQESVRIEDIICFDVREKIASSQFYRFNIEEQYFEKISPYEYLRVKELLVDNTSAHDVPTLQFKTFYYKFPGVKDSKSIGSGVEFLNRYLSSKMLTQPEEIREKLFHFLSLHKYDSEQLILNDRIKNVDQLNIQIDKAIKYLKKLDDNIPYSEFKHYLQDLGFEKGLGSNVKRVLDTLTLLDDLLQKPDHIALKKFISNMPMIFRIAVISPHGYFGQDGVLGLPDTGGQVVYILDQVKALEKSLSESLRKAGVNASPKIIILSRLIPNAGRTNCNVRLEKVYNTKNCWILRVPFRTNNPALTDNWISRFEIWPYLEEFANDSAKELLAEFGSRPDLVIGNYSDGNLVATILSKRFGVTQCNIAHALEKSKYLYSAMYWKSHEDQYHFSLQFTADLIAMNSANFIITSSYQEIAGTESSIGQYESYKNYTLPDLYRVIDGISIHHPKFNIVPPGVNESIYFPYTKKDQRMKEIQDELNEIIFGSEGFDFVLGKLENPDLIPIFSMARLDKIKNITGLVKWFAESKELQEISNLIIVAGMINPENSSDSEEREQIHLIHNLINSHNLHSKIRWIGKHFKKDESGEIYRIIADRKGIFIQPALFEAFGLTVLEAMISGVPVFATKYGGPLEIIQDGSSGFHIDPMHEKETVETILQFFKKCKENDKHWLNISKKGIERVNSTYTWKLYSEKLLSLSKIYGFWRYTSDLEMSELNAYLDVLYHLLYKPMAKSLLMKHTGT